MSTRSFTSPARLDWSACSLLLAASFLGCGGPPEEESEAVETRSDALDQCQTYDILQVDGDEGVGVRCSATICIKPNGCQWDHLVCEDGWDPDPTSRTAGALRWRVATTTGTARTRAAATTGTSANTTDGARVTRPLREVAIVTCGRPEALRRCLVSHARHARAHGRIIEHVVVSDTRAPADRDSERAMLRGLEREVGVTIRYAGSEEKRRFASLLARELGCERSLVDFAVFGPAGATHTAGANRNALLLETSGRKVWMVDDDTVCRPAALRGRRTGGALRPVYDPTEVRLCVSRDEAIGAVDEVSDDLFTAHDRTLGRSASTLVSTGEVTHGGRLPPAPKMEGRVVLSSLGIYGDSGARNSAFCCYRDDRVRAALWESEARHAALSTTREIVRGVRRLTLTLGMYCQSTSIALDNTEALVPFFPMGRGEDMLFGSMLRADRPDAWFAYQPYAILHAPWEARAADATEPAGPQPPPGVALIVATLLEAVMSQRPEHDALTRLAVDLRALGNTPPPEFQRVVAQLLARTVERRIAALSQELEAYPDAPPFWSQRLRLHIASWTLRHEALRSGSTLQLGSVPADIVEADVAPWVHRIVGRFADLVDAWPPLCDAAARLAEGGERLACPSVPESTRRFAQRSPDPSSDVLRKFMFGCAKFSASTLVASTTSASAGEGPRVGADAQGRLPRCRAAQRPPPARAASARSCSRRRRRGRPGRRSSRLRIPLLARAILRCRRRSRRRRFPLRCLPGPLEPPPAPAPPGPAPPAPAPLLLEDPPRCHAGSYASAHSKSAI